MKLIKRKKMTRLRGSRFHGHSLNKKGKGKRGGKGMAGTGKRADHKKSYVLKHLHPYFGKQGFTSRSTKKDKDREVINVGEIQEKSLMLIKKGFAKQEKDFLILNIKKYKVLGNGEINIKVKVNAKSISKTAKEKIEKAGGQIENLEKKEKRKKLVE